MTTKMSFPLKNSSTPGLERTPGNDTISRLRQAADIAAAPTLAPKAPKGPKSTYTRPHTCRGVLIDASIRQNGPNVPGQAPCTYEPDDLSILTDADPAPAMGMRHMLSLMRKAGKPFASKRVWGLGGTKWKGLAQPALGHFRVALRDASRRHTAYNVADETDDILPPVTDETLLLRPVLHIPAQGAPTQPSFLAGSPGRAILKERR